MFVDRLGGGGAGGGGFRVRFFNLSRRTCHSHNLGRIGACVTHTGVQQHAPLDDRVWIVGGWAFCGWRHETHFARKFTRSSQLKARNQGHTAHVRKATIFDKCVILNGSFCGYCSGRSIISFSGRRPLVRPPALFITSPPPLLPSLCALNVLGARTIKLWPFPVKSLIIVYTINIQLHGVVTAFQCS